jgi:hypothetical protein
MARPGYNEDNTLNRSVYSSPTNNRDRNMGHRNTGNNSGGQDSSNQISNDLDRMLKNRQQHNQAVVPTSTPDMQTGFGSWFGANSASTGSSKLVQDTIQNAINRRTESYTKGQIKDKHGRTIGLTADIKNNIVQDVMNNFYPSLPQMSKEEFLTASGVDINNPNEMNSAAAKEALLDFDISSMYTGYQGGAGNLMGIPEGQKGIDELNFVNPSSGGGGGGGGGGYGGGGGGGGGGDSGRGINYGSGSQVYQRGFPGAGDLQERVNQAYLSGGRKFARGGIVSLLRL